MEEENAKRGVTKKRLENRQTYHMQQPVFLLVTLAWESSTLYAYKQL